LGFFIYRREIETPLEKIPHLRLKTPTLIFPMILRYKTTFFKIWDFLDNGRRNNSLRKIP